MKVFKGVKYEIIHHANVNRYIYKVSRKSLEVVLNKNGVSLQEFTNHLKSSGWKGKVYSKVTDSSVYIEGYLSNLVVESVGSPKTIFSQKMKDYQLYPRGNAIQQCCLDFDTLLVKMNEEYDLPESFINNMLIFYDVEITDTDSFVGIKIFGFEIIQIQIIGFKNFMQYIANKFKNKVPIYIGYNDYYDSTVIYEAFKQHVGRKTTNLSAWDYANINHKIINYTDKLSKLIEYLEKFNVDQTHINANIDIKYNEGVIPTTNRYNKLNKLFELKDELNAKNIKYFTFDMFTEVFKSSGSLKFRCLERNITWRYSLLENTREYNKEDLINTMHLFFNSNCIDTIQVLVNMKDQVTTDITSLSTKLIISSTIYNACKIGRNKRMPFTNPDYHDTKKINEYIDYIYKRYDVKIENDSLIFEGNQKIILKKSDGGLHSECGSRTIMDGNIFIIDYAGFYPKLMRSDENPILNPAYKPYFEAWDDMRMELKQTNPIQAEIGKVLVNGTFGRADKEFKGLCNLVTYHGHCHIIEMMRVLDGIGGSFIDINTDGIIVSFEQDMEIDTIDEKLKERLIFPFTVEKLQYILYKCSGHYFYKTTAGKTKAKGSWLYSAKTEVFMERDGTDYKCKYNITNIKDILAAYIDNKKCPKPHVIKIQQKTNRSNKSYPIVTYSIHDTIDLPIDFNSDLVSSSLTKHNRPLYSHLNNDQMLTYKEMKPTSEQLVKWIVNSKLKACGGEKFIAAGENII